MALVEIEAKNNSTRNEMIIWLWCGYIITYPLRFFGAGSPQICDLFVLLLAVAIPVYNDFKSVRYKDPVILYLVAFIFYISIVNIFWFAKLKEFNFLISNLYYGYNAILFSVVVIVSINFSNSFVRYTADAIVASLLIQFVISIILRDPEAARQTNFFSNPNQLSYWTLVVTTIYFLFSDNKEYRRLKDILVIVSSSFLQSTALSKAGLLAFFLLILILLIQKRAHYLHALTAAVIIFLSNPVVKTRLGDIAGDRDDTPVGRGYGRLWEFPEHLVFGAGEGAYWRFAPASVRPIEFHSTIGNIIFSYGIIGFALCSVFIFYCFKKNIISHGIFLAPILLYGVAHQGLRMSFLWVFVAMVVSVGSALHLGGRSETRGIALAGRSDG